MSFDDFDTFYSPLELPISGRVFTIPPVGIRDGGRLTLILKSDEKRTIDDEEVGRMLLGTAYDEMVEANVAGPAYARVFLTALAEFQGGRAAAEVAWASGGDPKAMPQPTPEGAAATTQRRASTSGTRKKPASRSVKSSNTGA